MQNLIDKIFRWVVDYPKKVFKIYIVAIIICAVCFPLVGVNYDITDYLPKDSASTVAIDVHNEEFPGGIPNLRIMYKNISVADVLEKKELLSKVDVVQDVTWLDDQVDITIPLSSINKEYLDTYYKDGTAMLSLTIDATESVPALEAIKEVAGPDAIITGKAAMIATATERTDKEVPIIALGGVLFALFVLLFTTTSWAEPLIVLVGIGIAVILNAGSNIIFGKISFLTNASASVLQLAVSIDYSIFLLRRFEEEKENNLDSREALYNAMKNSLSSISASGLTTVIGFFALIFMRYGIGLDMGIVLAKGVLISLISVFTIFPALILAFEPFITRFEHRYLLPNFSGFADFAYKLRKPLLAVFVVVLIPAFLAYSANDYYYGTEHIYEVGSEFGDRTAETVAEFGYSDTYVLMVPKGDTSTEQKVSYELNQFPKVTSVLSYVDTVGKEIPYSYLDSDTLSLLESDNYSRFVINVALPEEGDATFNLVSDIRNIAQKYYPDTWYLAGNGASTYDLMDVISSDILIVNLIGIAAILLVLLLTFKSITLPVILVLSIEWAIWVNASIPYFRDTPIFFLAYLIVSSVQLGATVDYAILFTDRYLEFRQFSYKEEAARLVLEKCTPSILTSGLVLTVTGFMMWLISTNQIIAQLGSLLAIGTLLSLAVVIFVLPCLLLIFDGLIRKTTKDLLFIEDLLEEVTQE